MAVASGILRQEGLLAFYHGLSAGLLRQATYTTARLGTFNCISEGLKADGKPLPLWQKAAAGLAAGAVGAVVGSPADLTL
jgi:solute carrier family 25 oxoglutarate transporter 11